MLLVHISGSMAQTSNAADLDGSAAETSRIVMMTSRPPLAPCSAYRASATAPESPLTGPERRDTRRL